eukprot:403235-Pelagomonas_calceolata.AAC.1
MSIIQASSSLFWVLKEQQRHTTYFETGLQDGTDAPLLSSDLRLADKKGSWTYQVLTALTDVPHAQQLAAAVRTRAKVDNLEGVLHEHIIYDWRSLDSLTPQEAHASNRIMRYHIHFNIPLGSILGWWDERKRNKKALRRVSNSVVRGSRIAEPR